MSTHHRTQRTRRAEALGRTVGRLTGRIFGRRGLNDGAIVRHWPEIAGETLARASLPEKISFDKGDRARGTLQLRVSNSALATEIQHSEPLIVERINAYFGYQAVARLRLIHGPIPVAARRTGKSPPPLSAEQEAALKENLAGINDADIKTALERLGRAVALRKRR